MTTPRERKVFAVGKLGLEGQRSLASPLGRIKKQTPQGEVTVSARLNSGEIEDALFDEDPKNDLTATLSDAADAAEKIDYGKIGGRRKLHGGGKTYDALAALFTDAQNAFARGVGVADKASAFAVEKIPMLLKTAVAGSTLKYALNHPSLFANIVDLAKQLGQHLIMVDPDGATWGQYLDAATSIGGSFVELVVTAAQQPTTPAGTILLALFVMKYRSSQSGTSLTDLIKSDAAVLKELAKSGVDKASTAALAQYSAFLKAYEVGSQAVAVGQLKGIAQNIKKPSGPGAKEASILASGIPSVQSGPDGTIATVPAGKERDFKEALAKLTTIPAKIPPKEKAAAPKVRLEAEAVIGERPSEAEAVENALMKGGQRGKKTRRTPKRRMTRRRKAQKILGTPVFIY